MNRTKSICSLPRVHWEIKESERTPAAPHYQCPNAVAESPEQAISCAVREGKESAGRYKAKQNGACGVGKARKRAKLASGVTALDFGLVSQRQAGAPYVLGNMGSTPIQSTNFSQPARPTQPGSVHTFPQAKGAAG